GQFAEHIVEDRGRVLDAIIAHDHAGRLEAGEGEGLHEFVQRHAILKADRDGDGKVVHHRTEGGAFLVHVDEDFAQTSIGIFAGVDIDLVATNDSLLGVTLAAVRHLFAGADFDFALDDALDDLFGNGR